MTTLEVVEELNNDLAERFPDNQLDFFFYVSSGYCDAILFNNDESIWDSENDEREWIEGEDNRSGQYEDLLPFVKKKFNQYLERINKLKFE